MNFYVKLTLTVLISEALVYSSQLLTHTEDALGTTIMVFISSPILIGAGFLIGLIWNLKNIDEKFKKIYKQMGIKNGK